MRRARTPEQEIESGRHVGSPSGLPFLMDNRKERKMARRSRYLRYAEAVSMVRKQGGEMEKAAGRSDSHGSVLKRLKDLRTQNVQEKAEPQTTEMGGTYE